MQYNATQTSVIIIGNKFEYKLKMENELCGICTGNEKVNEFGSQAYGCELCPKWIHGFFCFF